MPLLPIDWKYLHKVGDHSYFLSHHLTPEVRAMFAAMTSRTPVGGLPARYGQVVEAVAESLYETYRAKYPSDYPLPWEDMLNDHRLSPLNGEPSPPREGYRMRWHVEAEDALTQYPLHPKVVEFFDQFVRNYGHSSILELTGSPTVYSDNLSWWTAWLLFDSPLVAGQENSTRAVTRKDWPVCREAYTSVRPGSGKPGDKGFRMELFNATPRVHPRLQEIHDMGMELANAEIEAWKAEFQSPCGKCDGKGCDACEGTGKKYPTIDKEPFRPALDRARWALPGTISTGVAFTAHVRDRARAIQDALAFYKGSEPALKAVREIQETYTKAVPGIGQLGLKEAWYEAPGDLRLPAHLALAQEEWEMGDVCDRDLDLKSSVDVHIRLPLQEAVSWTEHADYLGRDTDRSYADPKLNRVRVDVRIYCSVAVSRDWHRHRTMYPLQFRLMRDIGTRAFLLDPNYQVKSDHGREVWGEYFAKCRDAYDYFCDEGDYAKAMLCIPFGARVALSCQMGLRDFLYTMELRHWTPGANFEYKAQAGEALRQLKDQLERTVGTLDVEDIYRRLRL